MMVREEWVSRHRRVVIVDEGGRRVYSIDVYRRLEKLPRDARKTLSAGLVELYEARLGDVCRAVILATPAGVELISLRLVSSSGGDPASNSPQRALEICEGELESWLGSARY